MGERQNVGTTRARASAGRSSVLLIAIASRRKRSLAGAGYSGVHHSYRVREADAGVYLFLEAPSAERNRQVFERLQLHRATVEEAFGGSLEWVWRGPRGC
jgi:hypothetical protein